MTPDPLRIAARSALAVSRLEHDEADALRRHHWRDRASRLALAADLARDALGHEHADRITWTCLARIPQLVGTPTGRHPALPYGTAFLVLPENRGPLPGRLVIGTEGDTAAHVLEDGTTAEIRNLADVGRYLEDYHQTRTSEGDDTP